ncbi:MAG: hypothetical protein K6G50_08840 [bacterium]|nr:hypothetical protein [bacterium]
MPDREKSEENINKQLEDICDKKPNKSFVIKKPDAETIRKLLDLIEENPDYFSSADISVTISIS